MSLGYSVIGLGVTDVGRVGNRSLLEFEVEAARRAIVDAGISREQVGAAIQMLSDPGGNMRTQHDDSFARALGLPVNAYIDHIGRGGEYIATAMVLGMKFLDLGIADYVVVSGARDDWSRSRKAKAATGSRGTGSLHTKKEGVWGYQNGSVSALSFHSLLASRHIQEFGTSEETFGRIAVAQRAWAQGNPSAQMRGKRLDLDEYLDSPFLVWPYRMLDCSVQSDGGVAFVLTTGERAADAPRRVDIAGVGFGEQMSSLWWEKRNYTGLAVDKAKESAFGQAGISLHDIDVAQLYDCFTAEVLCQIEDYGWAEKGEAEEWLREGNNGPAGPVPINTGGGLLSGFHLGNLTGFAEAIIQLRGDGGDRQVPEAEIALVTGHGGEIISGEMCSIHSSLVLTGGNE